MSKNEEARQRRAIKIGYHRIKYLELLDSLGQVHQQSYPDAHSVNLDVSHLSKGLYYLRINNRYVRKVLILE